MSEATKEADYPPEAVEYDAMMVFHFSDGEEFYVAAENLRDAVREYEDYCGPFEYVGKTVTVEVCDPSEVHEQWIWAESAEQEAAEASPHFTYVEDKDNIDGGPTYYAPFGAWAQLFDGPCLFCATVW